MQNNQSDFQQKYNQLELLGRGNYGSAYIVQSNFNDKLYVAKKMNLDGMPEAEIQAAQGQIQILKKFSDTNMYPFIVKYVQCFMFDKTLIIVMEFCEHGDLAGFIKHAKKKGQLLEEKVILAWFVMLVMGIQALHSKNVLHRDLKSANIFLTSNKFVKIGDFGISKVLDATSAKTFVGTPYYLSPEVCSNKKYDFKSDLWSLGCILYQLCTLDYPFQANNILSLAMKITSEEVKPISNKYSKQLNEIVMGLLTKDQSKRKTLEQILATPYMSKFMTEHGHEIDKICEDIPLKKPTRSNVGNSNVGQSSLRGSVHSTAQDTMKTIQSNFELSKKSNSFSGGQTFNLSVTDTLSPKQKMLLRKEEKIRKEQEALKMAAKDNMKNRSFAHTMKQEQMGGSGSDFRTAMHKQVQEENKMRAQEERLKKQGLGDNQAIDLKELSELTKKINNLRETMNMTSSQLEQTIKNDSTMKNYTEPIDETKNEEVNEEEELEEYYDDDFQPYAPEQDQVKEAQEEIQAVSVFVSIVSGNTVGISPTKKKSAERAFEKKVLGPSTNREKMQDCIQQCIQIIGEEKYNLLYEMVSKCSHNGIIKQNGELKLLRVQGSRSQKHVLKLIDQIKYYESL